MTMSRALSWIKDKERRALHRKRPVADGLFLGQERRKQLDVRQWFFLVPPEDGEGANATL